MKRIVEILREVRPEYEFEGVEDVFAQGMLDSYDLVRLVGLLEERFHCTISGEDLIPENFRNLIAIEKLISRHGGEL